MKRMLGVLLAVVLWVTHLGTANAESLIDMDLASSNRMMTYAQMLQVSRSPETFEGQIFRLKGKFNYSQTKEQAKIIFSDNAGCCEISMAFHPDDDLVYPDDYPPLYADIMITGCLTIDKDDLETPVWFEDTVVEWDN